MNEIIKKIGKFLKYFLFIFLGMIALVYTVVYMGHNYIFSEDKGSISQKFEKDGFCFGLDCHEKILTSKEYIPLLAKQIKIYNEIASKLWPNNHNINQYAWVQSRETGEIWEISPTGEVSSVSQEEKDSMEFQGIQTFSYGFMYIKLNEKTGWHMMLSVYDLENNIKFANYPHLGTYDLFITYSHEGMHELEQRHWDSFKASEVTNKMRSERWNDYEARAIRSMIFEHLANAYIYEDRKNQEIKLALALYKEYKIKHNDDYQSAKYFDRIEGTAFYYEMVSSMMVSNPDKIKTLQDVQKAFPLIANYQKSNILENTGSVMEGYRIGGIACMLLDNLNIQYPNIWKNKLMKNKNLSPLDILEEEIVDIKDSPISVSQERINAMKEIDNKSQKMNFQGLFRLMYEILY